MGRHSDKTGATARDTGGGGKHRASERDMERDTAQIRVDRDNQGRVTGWAVGRDPGPDNYTGR